MNDPSHEEDSRLLTPAAFDFVFENELKRAVRSQNFLTLLVVDQTAPTPERETRKMNAHVTRVVSRELRETDLLSRTPEGRLFVVLLDADLDNSMRVVDRLLTRFEHYEFPVPATIDIGAACCPTHGSDAETLRRAADLRRVRSGGHNRGNGTAPQ
jgi:hypothetical protein